MFAALLAISSSIDCLASDAGNALQFDGSDDYVNIPGLSDYAFGTSDFTIEMWINPRVLSGNHRVLYCNQNLNNCQFNIDSGPSFSLQFYGDGHEYGTGSLTWDMGVWYHIAVSRISSVLRIYRDAIELGHTTFWVNVGNSTNITIGNRLYHFRHPFDGIIDEVRVWNIGRTQEEIALNYDLVIHPSTPGLIGYWRFDEDFDNQFVVDLSPTGNDGTLGENSDPDYDDPTRIVSTAPLSNPPVASVLLNPDGPTNVFKGDYLYFSAYVQNNRDYEVSGDLWLNAILPSSNEVLIPDGLLNYDNPISGDIFGLETHHFPYELWIHPRADTGFYQLIGRIGIYPDIIIDESSFGFHVIE
jgi:hypothetical protein